MKAKRKLIKKIRKEALGHSLVHHVAIEYHPGDSTVYLTIFLAFSQDDFATVNRDIVDKYFWEALDLGVSVGIAS